MKRALALISLLIFIPSLSCANAWWNDWRGDDWYDRYDSGGSYEDGFEEGYELGFSEGTEEPFSFDTDKAGAFGYWFLNQEWTAKELHAWEAVFKAMFDEKDRTGIKYKDEYDDPVYVAIVTGTVFHKEKECSGLVSAYMVEEFEMENAIERGFAPCKICSKEK